MLRNESSNAFETWYNYYRQFRVKMFQFKLNSYVLELIDYFYGIRQLNN